MTTTERTKLRDLRVCRVFFSSPFGGMEVEREILTRKYFPQIHHLCNSHGVQFVPVDMRWGITKEAGENAQVINICLRELDRSDMFVGFFGQRYGWHGKDDKLLQQNFDNAIGRYPWIDDYRHHSVTAVEFMHGYMNNPGLHPACFAFRNKDYDDKLKEEGLKKGDQVQVFKYSSESDYANNMMEGLKEDIIKSKDKLLGVHVDYNDPEEGARLLFETIWEYMTKELLVRDEELTESMRQLAEHDAYLSARTSIYLQGDEYINRLDDALNSNDAPPFIVLGDVGSGKSALLSNWINNHKSDNNDNVIWLYHFVGAASGSTAPKQILTRIINDLKSVIEVEQEKTDKSGDKDNTADNEGDGVWKLLEKLNLLLRKATHSGKKVIIVIDGLNKIQQAKKIMTAYYWVPKPKDLPQGVFMVLSTSSNDEAAHSVFVQQEKFHVLKIQPLEEETKKELCVSSLKESGKELSPHQLQKILDARLTNNPLYLMIVLWELSVFGSFRLLDDKIDSLLQAESVSGLFVKYLERLEEDYNTDETGDQFVQQVMSAMILSNKGISENEIQAIFNITSHGWSPLNFALEKFTISHFGLLKLGFIELHQAVEKRYLNNNPSFKKMMCEKLMNYFEEKRKELGSGGHANLRGNSVIDRVANELPHLQKLLNDKTGLLRSICDIHIFYNIIRQERYELLDLVYYTGFKLDKIACEFLKSFDQHIANVYIKRLETEKEETKSPGETCMHNLRNMGIVMELAGNLKGYEMISLRNIQLLVESSEPTFTCSDEGQETENEEENEEEYVGPDCTLTTSSVSEFASIKFHDYAGKIEFTVQKMLNKDIQTDKVGVSCSTQTEGASLVSISTYSVSTQTDHETPLCKCMTKTTSEVGVQVNKPDLTVEDIKSNEMCMFYTGLPNVETFNLLFDEMDDVEIHTNRCGNGENKGRPRSLRLIDEFFLVLMRLRLGLLLEDLARRFHVSKSTCSNITNQWISYMSVKLSTLVAWPSRKTLKVTMPQKFKRKYPNCRIIIDCTEFYTETPQSLANKSMMYSHYKSHMTWKALLGISPSGIITFVSDLWSGSISDKQLTIKSGLLDLCEAGDGIMADKGFLISDLTTPRSMHLIIPPLKLQKFSRRQVEETRRIANLRIDVERAMERVKNFRILQGVMPITLSKQASKILKICVALSNLLPPLVHDED